MSTDPMNFKINPSNFLGGDHDVFKSSLMELALSDPKKYFEIRRDVLEAVKKQAVDDAYDTYYYLLTKGQKKDGATGILSGKTSDGHMKFVPNMPAQEVNEFALGVSKTLRKVAEDCIEMILPADYRLLAENRQVQKTAGTLGLV